MKRYLLFAGLYPADGGWRDFINDADTVQELKNQIVDRRMHIKKYLNRFKILNVPGWGDKSADWWEIIDSTTKTAVQKESNDGLSR